MLPLEVRAHAAMVQNEMIWSFLKRRPLLSSALVTILGALHYLSLPGTSTPYLEFTSQSPPPALESTPNERMRLSPLGKEVWTGVEDKSGNAGLCLKSYEGYTCTERYVDIDICWEDLKDMIPNAGQHCRFHYLFSRWR